MHSTRTTVGRLVLQQQRAAQRGVVAVPALQPVTRGMRALVRVQVRAHRGAVVAHVACEGLLTRVLALVRLHGAAVAGAVVAVLDSAKASVTRTPAAYGLTR